MAEGPISAIEREDADVLAQAMEDAMDGDETVSGWATTVRALGAEVERRGVENSELRKIIAMQDQALRDVSIASGRSDETIRVKVGSTILATNGTLATLDDRSIAGGM